MMQSGFNQRTVSTEETEPATASDLKRPLLPITRRHHNYPLVRKCDMTDEMRTEALEACVTAYDKFPSNNENIARFLKEIMDRSFGCSWHVVAGEGFGFDITHQKKNLMYIFIGGNMAIMLWKCS